MQFQASDQSGVLLEADLRTGAERIGDPLPQALLIDRLDRRRADCFQHYTVPCHGFPDRLRQRPYFPQKYIKKRFTGGRPFQTRDKPLGYFDRKPIRSYHPGLLDRLSLLFDAHFRGSLERSDLLRSQGQECFALLISGLVCRGNDQFAFFVEARPYPLNLSKRVVRLIPLGLGLGQQFDRSRPTLLNDSRDRAPKEPGEQPHQDRDIDGLKSNRPPIDRHNIT